MGTAEFIAAYDAASDEYHRESSPRGHLGASQIGARCPRQAWYGYRWFAVGKVEPRMRRLWNRGHEEEDRFIRYLRGMGITVWDHSERLMYHGGSDSYTTIPWEDSTSSAWAECDDVSESPWHIRRATFMDQGPKQWSFAVDIGDEPEPVLDKFGLPGTPKPGHFAGSGDGILPNSSELAEWFPALNGVVQRGGCEFKTHGDKSFKDLVKKGVLSSKPVHYAQMQVYMKFFGLGWCLYLAVNKNTDEIYPELIFYKEEVATPLAEKGMKIVQSKSAPPKMTNDPSWFECKFCDFRNQCHFGAPAKECCRSCAFAEPVAGGQWRCNKHEQIIPRAYFGSKCGFWESAE